VSGSGVSTVLSAPLYDVLVDGCPISYRRLGPVDAPTLLLVHGGAAHSGWWAGVAPLLATEHQVVLVELSGHGDSGHRDDYGPELWARELSAVLGRTTTAPAVLVGHSMGGAVAAAAAARFPAQARGLVLVDTRLPLRDLPRPPTKVRHFASQDEALARFRLQPDRHRATPHLLEALALQGLRNSPSGWRWKFDPAARRRLTDAGVSADLGSVNCPIGYVYGAASDMGGATSLARLAEVAGRPVPWVSVADAHHHVPLDQPAACAAAILTVLQRMEPT
jgi:pimeloyl-ACP methyl ester carboxylesterase